jgi:hypothetical protein
MKRVLTALRWLRHWHMYLSYDVATDPFNRFADSQTRASVVSTRRIAGRTYNDVRDQLMGDRP